MAQTNPTLGRVRHRRLRPRNTGETVSYDELENNINHNHNHQHNHHHSHHVNHHHRTLRPKADHQGQQSPAATTSTSIYTKLPYTKTTTTKNDIDHEDLPGQISPNFQTPEPQVTPLPFDNPLSNQNNLFDELELKSSKSNGHGERDKQQRQDKMSLISNLIQADQPASSSSFRLPSGSMEMDESNRLTVLEAPQYQTSQDHQSNQRQTTNKFRQTSLSDMDDEDESVSSNDATDSFEKHNKSRMNHPFLGYQKAHISPELSPITTGDSSSASFRLVVDQQQSPKELNANAAGQLFLYCSSFLIILVIILIIRQLTSSWFFTNTNKQSRRSSSRSNNINHKSSQNMDDDDATEDGNGLCFYIPTKTSKQLAKHNTKLAQKTNYYANYIISKCLGYLQPSKQHSNFNTYTTTITTATATSCDRPSATMHRNLDGSIIKTYTSRNSNDFEMDEEVELVEISSPSSSNPNSKTMATTQDRLGDAIEVDTEQSSDNQNRQASQRGKFVILKRRLTKKSLMVATGVTKRTTNTKVSLITKVLDDEDEARGQQSNHDHSGNVKSAPLGVKLLSFLLFVISPIGKSGSSKANEDVEANDGDHIELDDRHQDVNVDENSQQGAIKQHLYSTGSDNVDNKTGVVYGADKRRFLGYPESNPAGQSCSGRLSRVGLEQLETIAEHQSMEEARNQCDSHSVIEIEAQIENEPFSRQPFAANSPVDYPIAAQVSYGIEKHHPSSNQLSASPMQMLMMAATGSDLGGCSSANSPCSYYSSSSPPFTSSEATQQQQPFRSRSCQGQAMGPFASKLSPLPASQARQRPCCSASPTPDSRHAQRLSDLRSSFCCNHQHSHQNMVSPQLFTGDLSTPRIAHHQHLATRTTPSSFKVRAMSQQCDIKSLCPQANKNISELYHNNHIKRQYENYYDDESIGSDAYRSLAASFAMDPLSSLDCANQATFNKQPTDEHLGCKYCNSNTNNSNNTNYYENLNQSSSASMLVAHSLDPVQPSLYSRNADQVFAQSHLNPFKTPSPPMSILVQQPSLQGSSPSGSPVTATNTSVQAVATKSSNQDNNNNVVVFSGHVNSRQGSLSSSLKSHAKQPKKHRPRRLSQSNRLSLLGHHQLHNHRTVNHLDRCTLRRTSIAGDRISRATELPQIGPTGPEGSPAFAGFSQLAHRASIASSDASGWQQLVRQQQHPHLRSFGDHMSPVQQPLADSHQMMLMYNHHHTNHVASSTNATSTSNSGDMLRPSNCSSLCDTTNCSSQMLCCTGSSSALINQLNGQLPGPNSSCLQSIHSKSHCSSSGGSSSSGLGVSGSACTNTPTSTSFAPVLSHNQAHLASGGGQLLPEASFSLTQQDFAQAGGSHHFGGFTMSTGNFFTIPDHVDIDIDNHPQQQQQQQQLLHNFNRMCHSGHPIASHSQLPFNGSAMQQHHYAPFLQCHDQHLAHSTVVDMSQSGCPVIASGSRKLSLPTQLEMTSRFGSAITQWMPTNKQSATAQMASNLDSPFADPPRSPGTSACNANAKLDNDSTIITTCSELSAASNSRTSQLNKHKTIGYDDSRRSSRTITRQSSFWLDEAAVGSMSSISNANLSCISLKESSMEPSMDTKKLLGNLEASNWTSSTENEQSSVVETGVGSKSPNINHQTLDTQAQVDQTRNPDEPDIKPSLTRQARSSSSSSSLGNGSNGDAPKPSSPRARHFVQHHNRLSSSSTSTSSSIGSSPSPDFSRPSERILALVSKSAGISKRQLFGSRVHHRVSSRRQQIAAASRRNMMTQQHEATSSSNSSAESKALAPLSSSTNFLSSCEQTATTFVERAQDLIQIDDATTEPRTNIENQGGEAQAQEISKEDIKQIEVKDQQDDLKPSSRKLTELSSLSSCEHDDVEGNFSMAGQQRTITDHNSASLERQCRDLWKLRATLHEDSFVDDDWSNYHQRLNRRFDSGYRSMENQQSSSLEGNPLLPNSISLSNDAKLPGEPNSETQTQADTPKATPTTIKKTEPYPRPQSGCSMQPIKPKLQESYIKSEDDCRDCDSAIGIKIATDGSDTDIGLGDLDDKLGDLELDEIAIDGLLSEPMERDCHSRLSRSSNEEDNNN